MSVYYGFYNSRNGDRKYNATDFSKIFDGLISDGVFMSIGNKFKPVANGTNNTIMVGDGKAWTHHTWTINDGLYPVNMSDANPYMDRIDAIVLEVNDNENFRCNRIVEVTGNPSHTPARPKLSNANGVYQDPICFIYRKAGSTKITTSDVEYVVGRDFPFVNAIVENISVKSLFDQMEAQFDDWFKTVKNQLDNDQAGHLQNEITKINDTIKDYSAVKLKAENAVQTTDMAKVLFETNWDQASGTLDIGVGMVPRSVLREIRNV